MTLGILAYGDVSADALADRAAAAERLGFDYFWVGDERFFREPFQLLAMAAKATRRIVLGPCVVDPYTRHPALIATAIATLDEVSDGRAIAVLGAGKSGFREMGIDRVRSAKRLSEAVELIRRLMTSGRADFRGEEITFDDGRMNMPTRHDLQLWIATEGPLTLRAAAQVADAIMVSSSATRDELIRTRTIVDESAAAAGRARVPLHLRIDVSIADDREKAVEAIRSVALRCLLRHRDDDAFMSRHGVSPVDVEWLKGLDYKGFSREPEFLSEAASRVPLEYMRRFVWFGDDAEVAAAGADVTDLVESVTLCPITVPKQSWTDLAARAFVALAPTAHVGASPTPILPY